MDVVKSKLTEAWSAVAAAMGNLGEARFSLSADEPDVGSVQRSVGQACDKLEKADYALEKANNSMPNPVQTSTVSTQTCGSTGVTLGLNHLAWIGVVGLGVAIWFSNLEKSSLDGDKSVESLPDPNESLPSTPEPTLNAHNNPIETCIDPIVDEKDTQVVQLVSNYAQRFILNQAMSRALEVALPGIYVCLTCAMIKAYLAMPKTYVEENWAVSVHKHQYTIWSSGGPWSD